MQHVLDVLHIEPGERWALIGKGPSFDSDLVSKLFEEGYKLCSINNAFDACNVPFDLCIFVDWRTSLKFQETEAVDLYATASEQHRNIPKNEKFLGELFDQTDAMCHLDLSAFDIFDAKHFPNHKSIYCVTSSAEAALHILLSKGVRSFECVGIDGGFDYHSDFSDESRAGHGDLIGQFQGFSEIAKRFPGCEINGLDPRVYKKFPIPHSRSVKVDD